MTSIVAGGATAIYAAWHFQQMPSLGLFTNLTAMPIVSAVVMPFAVLGALAMPFGLDGPFFDVMGLGLTATIAIARWFSERSPADIVGLVPPASVAVLTVALLIATVCSTWLRVAAVPVALAGLVLLVDRPQPDLFVSEDGRLVGLAVGEGRIAVNRARPNEFTIDNWQRAMRADEIVRPEGKQERATASPTNRAEAHEELTNLRVATRGISVSASDRHLSPGTGRWQRRTERSCPTAAANSRRSAISSPRREYGERMLGKREGAGGICAGAWPRSQRTSRRIYPTPARTPASPVPKAFASRATPRARSSPMRSMPRRRSTPAPRPA